MQVMQLIHSTKYNEGRRFLHLITWLLNPCNAYFLFASLSDGFRQKGHEPGCGFSKLVHSLYHVGLSLPGDI